MMRRIFALAALTAVYALALASADPWDLAIGATLALAVLLAFGRFILPDGELSPRLVLRRAAHVPALVFATAVSVVRGTIQVARVVLGQTSSRHAGFVEIPNGDRSETGVVIGGLLDTLSPGSVLIEIDPERHTWTIHALVAPDEAAVRAELDRLYERYQRHVWP